MKIYATPNFRRQAKKLRENQLVDLRNAIHVISKNPEKGTRKKGILADIHVYKFPMNKQLTLLAYKVESDSILLYAVGSYENFYRTLEQHLH